MKKIIYSLAIIISVLSCIKLYSQQGWIPQQTGFSFNITSVHFLNNMYGMAVSSTGEMIKTTNGGLNWIALNPGMTLNYAEVRIVDSNIICAAGTSSANSLPAIIRTSNAGLNWSVVWTGTIMNYTFNNLKFFNDSGVVCLNKTAIVGQARALKSNNGGLNWVDAMQAMGIGSPQHFGFASSMVYWYLSFEETFNPNYPPHYEYDQYSLRTTTGGTGWNYTQYESNLLTNYDARIYLCRYNNTIGYSIKNNTDWRKSTNGGQSWFGISSPSACSVQRVWIVDVNRIYFTGLKNSVNYVIGKSTNGGSVWTLQLTPQNYVLNNIYFLNENTGWIGSANGIILKTTDGGVTPVVPVSEKIPETFNLSQNYPNPFNPTTTISFKIPSGEGWLRNADGVGLITLAVYDVTGRLVQTLVKGKLQPGTYEATFDGSMLNSGVYFYKLITNGFTETKKMALIK